MEKVKFQNKLIICLFFLFLISCKSDKENALSNAYSEFDYHLDDLRLDNTKFEGPIKLVKNDRNFFPRKNHVLYGWNRIVEDKTIWIYVEVDTTFAKEPSTSFSNNFFETIDEYKLARKHSEL